METATFGAGCFWCIEAVFLEMKGIIKVEPGYAGGVLENPTYKDICTGTTGHAEVVQVEFDPTAITYEELLEVFWKVHDPTQLNRQGNDIGTQYRSVIFYHNATQKLKAELSLQALEESKVWDDKIVTQIQAINNYSTAEAYHFNYFNLNPGNPYCAAVVGPKVEKFKQLFKAKLKSNF